MNTSMRAFRRCFLVQIVVLTAVFLVLTVIVNAASHHALTDSIGLPASASGSIASADDLSASILDENVLALDRLELRGDRVYYTVRALAPGRTFLRIDLANTGAFLAAEEFETETFGRVICTRSGNYPNCRFHLFMNTLFLTLLSFLCLFDLLYFRRRLLYSYELMFIGGMLIWLVCTSISLWFALLTFQSVYAYYDVMQTAGYHFMLYTAPVVLSICAALSVSNVSLMRHEGFRTANALGLLISALLFFGSIVGIAINNIEFTGPEGLLHAIHIGISAYTSLYSLFACLLEGAIIGGFAASRHVPPPDRDYIIILGCMIRKDGTLPPLIRGRVDRALAHDRMQQQRGGKPVVFVPSGGQGPREVMPEAVAMKNYLLAQGVPEERILVEDRSRNTAENMRFSKALIDQQDPHAKIAFSTTNYHVFRSGIIAGQANFHPEGMGSRTKWYFWPNAFIREYIGMLSYTRRSIAIILTNLVLAFAFIEFLILR